MKELKNHSEVQTGAVAKMIVDVVSKKQHVRAEGKLLNFDDEEDFRFSQQTINSFNTRVAHANDILDQTENVEAAEKRLAQQ